MTHRHAAGANRVCTPQTLQSMVRLCVVAPTVNVQVGGSTQPVSCKPHLPHAQLQHVIQEQVLPKFVSAFLQSADATAPDGSPLQTWLRTLATDMQKSIERHLQQQFAPDSPAGGSSGSGGLAAGGGGSGSGDEASADGAAPAQSHVEGSSAFSAPAAGSGPASAVAARSRIRPRSGRRSNPLASRSPLGFDPAERPKTAPSADPALRARRQRGSAASPAPGRRLSSDTEGGDGSAAPGDEKHVTSNGGGGIAGKGKFKKPPLRSSKSSKSLRAGLSYGRGQGGPAGGTRAR